MRRFYPVVWDAWSNVWVSLGKPPVAISAHNSNVNIHESVPVEPDGALLSVGVLGTHSSDLLV